MTSPWLIWIVTFLYAGEAGRLLMKGNYDFALILCGYVIANIGLIRVTPK